MLLAPRTRRTHDDLGPAAGWRRADQAVSPDEYRALCPRSRAHVAVKIIKMLGRFEPGMKARDLTDEEIAVITPAHLEGMLLLTNESWDNRSVRSPSAPRIEWELTPNRRWWQFWKPRRLPSYWWPCIIKEEDPMNDTANRAMMSFSEALLFLKAGALVARQGWNGKGMWLDLQRPDEHSKMTLPYVFLNYPAGDVYPTGARVPWAPSQTDLLADDWEEVQRAANEPAQDGSGPPALSIGSGGGHTV